MLYKSFRNWKKALEKDVGFSKHESSEAHKQANDRLFIAPKTARGDIGDLLSDTHANNKEQSKKFLLKILQNIRFLARQSLAFRGNWNYEEKNEEDSNYYQLLKLRCEDDAKLTKWLNKSTNRFTSPAIQNEMLEIMALQMPITFKRPLSTRLWQMKLLMFQTQSS